MDTTLGDVPQTAAGGGPGLTSSTDLGLAHSPVKVDILEVELMHYKQVDSNTAQSILYGFKHGFSLNYTGPHVQTDARNLLSARQNPNIVREKISKEIAAGRVAGPFSYPPFRTLRISPLGLVPKKARNDHRLIHHLSYPTGQSVNDYIDPELCTVQYSSFDEAVQMIQKLGPGCLVGKADIKGAFRILPVSPVDFDQLGFKFENKFYYDKAMPFGCSISCATFERFGKFLSFVVRRRTAVGDLVRYLDDFLFGGKKGTDHCQMIMLEFQKSMDHLGVPVADEKTEGPKTVIVFLGLEIDSVDLIVKIPMVKVKELIQKIQDVLNKEKVTLRVMQSLIGSLNFACRVIVPGRPFCRRLVNSICGLSKPHHHLRINHGIRQDLHMWLTFFEQFNGISVFHDRFWVTNEDMELFTDSAAGVGLGFGIYFGGKWAYAPWPEEWHDKGFTRDITVLELFPLLVSLYIWGSHLQNKKILFRCDNMAVVAIVNTMTSKSEEVMVLLRDFTLKCMQLNIMVKASHVEGVKNVLTDSLSRLQIGKFRELAPEAEPMPAEIPLQLWNIFTNV
ncbi:MAG: reverse transcriptase domain-containing protein [Sedimenticola sp.]